MSDIFFHDAYWLILVICSVVFSAHGYEGVCRHWFWHSSCETLETRHNRKRPWSWRCHQAVPQICKTSLWSLHWTKSNLCWRHCPARWGELSLLFKNLFKTGNFVLSLNDLFGVIFVKFWDVSGVLVFVVLSAAFVLLLGGENVVAINLIVIHVHQKLQEVITKFAVKWSIAVLIWSTMNARNHKLFWNGVEQMSIWIEWNVDSNIANWFSEEVLKI